MYGRCWEYTNLMLNSSHRGTISGVKQPKLTPKANLSPEVGDPRFSLDTQGYRSGDNGEGNFPNEGHVVKDSDNCFTVWCTGRTGCDWMMAQLRINVVIYPDT
ncbi:hypothetical protein EMCRGX_G012705 [Ephydatia muelleri]